ncbi:MAG: ribbon-helix-helix protein, CopG family [Phycisphaerae bacterium]|nr:ribbon-helix-helix protein, CopG family [Phycisphaerae bacterium]NIP54620.1 ribbon-helix-helix protein, CopG family [Phycisphaerae bacterium]NIW45464.1 ribbon-helix-helix protein, CopG family [Gammaproteobacteria bacterium]NIX30625.1 ribbon-helix-helix protein, CopG family [Phycisphaerae bacterium]
MEEKMVRTQVYLPRDIYEQLKERADKEGLTMASQIREALAQYVVESKEEDKEPVLTKDDPIWDMIGMGKSDITDGSYNHDKYIYARDWDLDDEEA